MKKEQITFHDIPFTAAAGQYAMEAIAKTKAKDRKYLHNAFVNEFKEIESVDHQYMTMADVMRVLRVFGKQD